MRDRPRTMYLLNQANQAVRSQLEAALRDLQMTGIQYTILTIVDEHEGISSAELSRRFFVTAQTMNEIINGLEQRGLVARKEDPANKRILRMKLTAQGRKLLKKCEDVADRIEEAAFDWVDPKEYEVLRRSLRALLQGLRERKSMMPVQIASKRTAGS
jgi:DNA-binding MarR family transcriptional regulator